MTRSVEVFGHALPLWEVAVLLGAGVVLAALLRRLLRRWTASTGVKLASLVAVMATGVSMNTSWRFFGDHLHITAIAERAFIFSIAEAALISFAVMARENKLGDLGRPGAPGVLVWVISGASTIPAWIEAGPLVGTVRALFGPVLAAVLWHYALGLELRQGDPNKSSDSVVALALTKARRDLLVRFGVITLDKSVEESVEDRALDLAVRYGRKFQALSRKRQDGRQGRRLVNRIGIQVIKANVEADPKRREKLRTQLALAYHVRNMLTEHGPSPWDTDTATEPAPGLPQLPAQAQPPALEHVSVEPVDRQLVATTPIVTDRVAEPFRLFPSRDEQLRDSPDRGGQDDALDAFRAEFGFEFGERSAVVEPVDPDRGEEDQDATGEEPPAERTLSIPVQGTMRWDFEMEADRLVDAGDKRILSDDNRERIKVGKEIRERLGLDLKDTPLRKYVNQYFLRRTAPNGNSGEAAA